MKKSIGIIETKGYTGAINAIDMMLKMTFVEVLDIEYVGDSMICIIIEGDIDSVREALDVGEEVLYKYGGVIAKKCIGNPFVEI